MAETAYPLTRFYFRVDIGGTEMSFQEVTGLNHETQVIEYRYGDSPTFSPMKIPGIVKSGNVTMKRGVIQGDNTLWDEYYVNYFTGKKIERITITIKLLDPEGNDAMIWTLENAWPTKIVSTDLKADGNEIAIETIEWAHEGLTIQVA
ncbi:phage tail protein [soil metagenome]